MLVGGLTLILQTGDNPASNAREFTGTIAKPRSFKADRWMSPATRPGIYGTRLSHLWDGTPDKLLDQMVAPQPDKMMLAYAPEITVQHSDALGALKVFDEPVRIVKNAPRPLPRPGKALSAEEAKTPGLPVALLSKLPKTAASIKALVPLPEEGRVRVASLTPQITPAPAPPTDTTVAALNLPYTLQIPSVRTDCFPKQLVSLIGKIEANYKKKVVITSGYRRQDHARTGSLHVHCAAADIVVPGIPSNVLATYVRSIPGVGGVGRYCHPYMIHIDIGRQRDWAFGCARKKAPADTTAKKKDSEDSPEGKNAASTS